MLQGQIKSRLGANPIPIQLPIGSEDNFTGVVDLVANTAFIYKDDFGNTEEAPIPEDMEDLVADYREKLLDAVAETDEDLMMKYLEGEELTQEEIIKALRTATIGVKIIPGSLWICIQK